jgi:sugar phosphate isomerase/epimerase
LKIALHQITTRTAAFADDMRAYPKAGWSAFELHADKARAYIEAHDHAAYRDLVKASGLTPVACTGHVVTAFGDSDAVRANRVQFEDTLALMEDIGCPVIVFGGDGPADPPTAADSTEAGLAARDAAYRADLDRFANAVGELADLAAGKGVTMALEMNWCRLCRSVAVSPSRLSDLDSVKGRIAYGHLDDFRAAPPEVTNVNSDRVIPGDGVFPLLEWYEKIEQCGYHGWHAVELFCEDLWQQPVDDIARRVLEGCRRVWPEAQF